MTTATETQPTSKFNRHAAATKLFFDCGHAELKPLNATEYRHVSVAGLCTACRHVASSSAITLSNFRVVYHAPRYEDGKVLYDGYCAILADDAEHGEVRVFDVPDVDEGQLAAALFACDAMNQYARLVEALRLCLMDSELVAMSGNPIARERVRIANEALATTTSR